MGFRAPTRNDGPANIRMLRSAEPGQPDGVGALKKSLAQSPNTVKVDADEMLPVSVVRELANGSPADRARLRQMVSELSPRGQTNLMHSIVHGTRDPKSPANNVSVTPEGQLMLDVTFNGVEPDADYLARIGMGSRPDVDDPVPVDNLLQEPEELIEKSAPDAPKGSGRRDLSREPAFRSREGVEQREDGSFRVKHEGVHLDSQTKRAIDRANEGLPVSPIYDDSLNTPSGRPAGRALASGMTSPHQMQTQLVQRLAEIRDPHGGALGDSMKIEDMEDLGITGGVDHSVFAPKNSGSVQGRSVATVRPQDHADAMRAWQAVRRGDVSRPNQQYASAEEMARDLMSNISQEGFNVTPVTARQRRAATNLVEGFKDVDSVDAVVERAIQGPHTPASAGQLVRSQFPEAVSATKTAERAVMQEQAIATLARKLESIFGPDGWKDNYKPSIRPATTDMPSTVTGPRDGTSQIPDPGMKRGEYEEPPYDQRMLSYEQEKDRLLRSVMTGDPGKETGYFDPSSPLVPTPSRPRPQPPATGRPGTDIDPEATPEELAERAALLEGDGPELPGGEMEGKLLPGRALGDKARTTPSKARKEGGNATDEYEDPSKSYAEYNKRNVQLSDSDAAKRQRFFDDWQKVMEMDPGRSSLIRQELDALTMDESPMTPERVARIEELQSRLRLTERLDSMSGVRSFRLDTAPPQTGMIVRPQSVGGDLAQPVRPVVDAEIIEPSFDLTGKPHRADDVIDAEFDVVPARRADPQSTDMTAPDKAPDVDVDPATQPKGAWKKWAAAAAAATGLGWALQNAGQPPSNPPLPPAPPVPADGGGGGGNSDPPTGGPDGFPPFAADRPKPPQETGPTPQEMQTADRIRMLRSQMRLNPNTQTLQNWTN